MYPCYDCNSQFDSILKLCRHIDLHHLRKKSYSRFYKCAIDNCFQCFQTSYSFKRHILRCHSLETPNPHKIVSPSAQYQQSLQEPVLETSVNNLMSADNNVDGENVANVNNFNFNPYDSNELLEYVCNLHSKPNLSRLQVTEIYNSMAGLISYIINCTKNIFITKCEININNDIEELVNSPLVIFEKVNTEYKLLKYLQEKNLYVQPKSFEISLQNELVFHNGVSNIDCNHSKGVLMPIEFQIKSFFELPKIFEEVINNTEKLCSERDYLNFVNGNRWKSIMNKYEGNIVIPYFLYNDDFQVDDALGSHSGEHSVSGFYYSFPTLPDHCCSALDNIFLAMLVKSKYVKTFGNKLCLRPLVEILHKIETEGIQINTESRGELTVRFVLGLLIGDNLGLNSILGFSKSFNANFYCRFCKIPKSKANVAIIEDPTLIRNQSNYEQDLIIQDFSITGISDNCILNSLENFHATTNYSVDIMHDIFLGVCKYGICQVVLFYIKYTGFFSLELLNYRKQNFDYGSIEIGNFSLPIKLEHIKNNIIHMSARETWCFVSFFPLIIGDLVPENDVVWEYVIALSKIIDIALCPIMTKDLIIHFNNLISRHNELFLNLFKVNLKPKHHFMTHYATIIKESGPLKHLWSFRFEAKHQQLKAYAKNITSRINILYSIAIKFSLVFVGKLLRKQNMFEKITNIKLSKVTLNEINCFELIKTSLSSIVDKPETVFDLRSVDYNRTKYSTNFFVFKDSNFEYIFEISHIFIVSKTVYLICSVYDVLGFNDHLHSYQIGNKISNLYKIIAIDEFKYPPVNLHKVINGNVYARVRTF